MKAYNKSQKAIWDNHAVLESAKMEGIQKTIIQFHKAGASLEMIHEATGLSLDEINKLLEENLG